MTQPQKILIGISALALVIFGGYKGIQKFLTIGVSDQNIQLVQMHSLKNFPKNTNIEIISSHDGSKITARQFVMDGDDKIQPLGEKFINMSYRIKIENKFIDVKLSKNAKTNHINAKITGLKKGNSVQLNNARATPVDWAGQIELNAPLSQNYCLTLQTQSNLEICHFTKEEVTS